LGWADKAVDVTRRANEIVQVAHALKCRGDLRLLSPASVDGALDDLAAAKKIAEHHGLAPLLAECDLSLADACKRAGRGPQARKHASRAVAGFRVLGLERHLVNAEKLAV
jgi:hypothetical protein